MFGGRRRAPGSRLQPRKLEGCPEREVCERYPTVFVVVVAGDPTIVWNVHSDAHGVVLAVSGPSRGTMSDKSMVKMGLNEDRMKCAVVVVLLLCVLLL